MNHVSLFSGIDGFGLAADAAGIDTVAVCEIDKHCQKLLREKRPNAVLYTDVKDVSRKSLREHGIERVDVLTGGFPCQDLSVAGRRKGLAGERSGLWFEFLRIIEDCKPSWVVIENVPGLLSSHGGRDFGVILQGLAQCGYGFAWRVLDAQYFGLAQRRKRVFVVASLGNGSCAEILFEPESVSGNPPPSRETRAELARDVAACLTGGGGGPRGYNIDAEHGLTCIPLAATLTGGTSVNSNPLGRRQEDDVNLVVNAITPVRGGADDNDAQAGHIVIAPFNGQHITSKTNRASVENNAPVPTLDSMGQMSVVVAGFSAGNTAGAGTVGYQEEQSPTLRGGASGTNQVPTVHIWEMSHADEAVREHGDIAPTLQARMGTGGNQVPMVGVRRLTPLECERLQGFPDNWTEGFADSTRYKMCGNAIAVPVVEWIIGRIAGCNE